MWVVGFCLVLALLQGCAVFAAKSPSQPKVCFKGVELAARVEPSPLRLSETRRATVVLMLKNRSRRFVWLKFPTTQRIEVLVRDPGGNQIVQWSEDQAFEDVPFAVGINPGEHLEYRAVVGTRDFVPNQRHIVAVFVSGYPKLGLELPLTPKP